MSQAIVFDPQTQSIKNLAWWLYVFHAFSLAFTFGALSWIPLVISYVKRGDAAGTFVYSHHSWQIHSFWWYLVWMGIGGLLAATIILSPLTFFVIWPLAWVWKAYRLIRGFVELNNNQPMPA